MRKRSYARAFGSRFRSIYNVGRGLYGAYRGAKRMRFKYRKTRTRTKTKTRTRRQAESQRLGSAHWLSHSGWGRKMPHYLKQQRKAVAVNQWMYNSYFVCTSSSGQQKCGSDGAIPYAHVYTPYEIQTRLASSDTIKTEKLGLLNCKLKIVACNTSNNSARVDLYTIICKKEFGSSVNPTDVWIAGLTEEGADAAAINHWNTKPTDASNWKRYFKILKIDRHSLAPGESFQHNFKCSPNRTFYTAEAWKNSTVLPAANYGGIPGLTTWVYPIVWGNPAADDATEAITTLGPTKVRFVYSKIYSTCHVEDNSATHEITVGLDETIAAAAFSIMEPDGDETTYLAA